jgi:hypothetical protein
MIVTVDKTPVSPTVGTSEGYTAYRDLGPRPKCVVCDDIEECPECPVDKQYRIPVVPGDLIYRQFHFADNFNSDPENPVYGWYGDDHSNYYIKSVLDFGQSASINLDAQTIIESQNVGYYNGSFQNIVLNTQRILEYINAQGYDQDCFRLVVTSYRLIVQDYVTVNYISSAAPSGLTVLANGLYAVINSDELWQSQNGEWVFIRDFNVGDIVFNIKSGRFEEYTLSGWVFATPETTFEAVDTCTTAWYKFLLCNEPSIVIESFWSTEDCKGFYYGQTQSEQTAGLLHYRDRYRIEASFELQSFPTEKTFNENGDQTSFKKSELWLLRNTVAIPQSIADRISDSMMSDNFYVNSNQYKHSTDVRKLNDAGYYWYISVTVDRVSCEKFNECNDDIFFNPIVVCDECTDAICADVTITRDGVFYNTAPCGSTVNVISNCGPSQECEDAHITNYGNTYNQDVPSGDTFELPNIDVTEINGTTYPIPAQTDFVCSWVPITIEDQDGNVLEVVNTYPTGEVVVVTIPECILMEHLTTAQVQALIDGGPSDPHLTEGVIYNVTDLAGTDCGGWLTALSETELSLHGEGCFLNPDFQSVGDYSGVIGLTGVAITTTEGVWSTAYEIGVAATGQVVFWNGLHYQNIDNPSTNGSAPDVNTTAYQVLPKATAGMGYVAETCFIEFDWLAGSLQKRTDTRSNNISSAIGFFQFGNDVVTDNVCDASSSFSIINIRSSFIGNKVSGGASLILTNLQTDPITGNTLLGLSTSVDASADILLADCVINYDTGITIGEDHVGEYLMGDASSFSALLVISGLSTINLNSVSYCGIINLSSTNATENINKITNINQKFPVDFRPETGLIVTFTGTPIASVTADGQLIMPDATQVYSGTQNNNVTFRHADTGAFDTPRQVDGNNQYI